VEIGSCHWCRGFLEFGEFGGLGSDVAGTEPDVLGEDAVVGV
jgi:hypothetical protein